MRGLTQIPMLMIAVSAFLYSCDDESSDPELDYVKYGYSFGECGGYCLTEIEVRQTEVAYIHYGWENSVTPITKELNYLKSQYDELIAVIAIDVFQQLDPVIGCPDCADGGAEWIELTVDGRTKRVTFEYLENVDGLDSALSKLRDIDAVFKED